jgi:hypothetical protein
LWNQEWKGEARCDSTHSSGQASRNMLFVIDQKDMQPQREISTCIDMKFRTTLPHREDPRQRCSHDTWFTTLNSIELGLR